MKHVSSSQSRLADPALASWTLSDGVKQLLLDNGLTAPFIDECLELFKRTPYFAKSTLSRVEIIFTNFANEQWSARQRFEGRYAVPKAMSLDWVPSDAVIETLTAYAIPSSFYRESLVVFRQEMLTQHAKAHWDDFFLRWVLGRWERTRP